MNDSTQKKVLISCLIIVFLTMTFALFVGLGMVKIPGVTDSRIRTIKEHAVDYDKIPRLNEATAEKIKMAKRKTARTGMIVGIVFLVILGFSIVLYQVKKGKKTGK